MEDQQAETVAEGCLQPEFSHNSRQRFNRLGSLLGGVLASGLILLSGCGDQSSQVAGTVERPPPEVSYMEVKIERVPWAVWYAGRTEGIRRVEIRARVEGQLMERHYTEGAVVREGDLLFTIDPNPPTVALQKAEAELQRAQASFNQSERDWKRIQSLFASNAVSERERDVTQSQYELAQADVAVAEAAVADAQLTLGYTTVNAPVSGVTSLEVQPQGSLIQVSDLLTTITQFDPIYVRFSISEADPAFGQLFPLEGAEDQEQHWEVTLHGSDGSTYPNRGTVNFTESSVSPSTGTVQLRASFPNENHRILPGQFVRVQIDNLSLPPAAVVPEASIVTSPDGVMVYTVASDNTLRPTPVTLGPVLPGGRQIVHSGLSNGDRVVSSEVMKLRPGMKVIPSLQPAETAEPAAQQPAKTPETAN